MLVEPVLIRELVAWGFDEHKFRPEIHLSRRQLESVAMALASRDATVFKAPLLQAMPVELNELLARQAERDDLREEMSGLEWTIGAVDLRGLVAFQRRLIFDDQIAAPQLPAADDWGALVGLCFGAPVRVDDSHVYREGAQWVIQSGNPNLQIRQSHERGGSPVLLHGGSPFLEVGEYRGRWFLRDGYHRAYYLLRSGVAIVPAVIVRARSLAELGPVKPHFFTEEILFSSRPPLIADFLDDDLIIEYRRPRLFKTLRVTIEESLEPTLFTSNQGE